MADSTLGNLTAATAATGGLFYGTQSGNDRKFTLTAAGASVIEAANAAAQITAIGAAPLAGATFTGAVNIGPFTGATLSVQEGAAQANIGSTSFEFYNSDDGFGTTLQPGAISGNVTITLPSATGTLQTTNTIPSTIQLACSDETTALTAGTAKVTFRMPYAMTLTGVRSSVTTAPTGSTLIVNIKENGTTILGASSTQKLSIDATEKTSTTAANAVVIADSALANDAEITIDIDQIGSTIAGTGLKVTLIGTRA